mgnify:CR=1 FL=1
MVGIDRINYYTPRTYLDMTTLAEARGVDPNKYIKGIGQEQMAVLGEHEDIITMAAEAAAPILDDKDAIDLIVFATESGVDFSKAASIYLQHLLEIPNPVRAIEMKQACYALTSGLHLATDFVKSHPGKKALVVSSDIAWYGFETAGEVTQGAGAIAIIVAENPRIARVNSGVPYTEDVPDFYRPNTSDVPIVDGKFSIDCYNKALIETFPKHTYKYVGFHMPFAKMADKANRILEEFAISDDALTCVKSYSKTIGNIYNGSLYLALIGILTHADDLSGETIGMFSYGSGSIGEFFTLDIVEGYDNYMDTDAWQTHLTSRHALDMKGYEQAMNAFMAREKMHDYAYQDRAPEQATYVLSAIRNGHREYQKR